MSVALTELWQMGAMALADAIRSKEASCQEVMEAHLRRIEEVNASINAVVVLLAEQAVEAAQAADRAVVAGGELPPLLGVPFTVKDLIDLVGTPTTQGLKAFGMTPFRPYGGPAGRVSKWSALPALAAG